jgi:hypothetical protein
MATGIHAAPVAAEFLEHATEEMLHADAIAKRIVELGGEPNFSPDGLSARSHAEYVEGANLKEMISEDLVAERVAIESYREMIAIGYAGPDRSALAARTCMVLKITPSRGFFLQSKMAQFKIIERQRAMSRHGSRSSTASQLPIAGMHDVACVRKRTETIATFP